MGIAEKDKTELIDAAIDLASVVKQCYLKEGVLMSSTEAIDKALLLILRSAHGVDDAKRLTILFDDKDS